MTPSTEQILADAEASEAVVAIKRADGKIFVGKPRRTDEPLVFSVRTGRRGRPAVIHVDDVEEVTLVQ